MIGLINYGAGNLGSVMNALGRLGVPSRFVSCPEELLPQKSGAAAFDKVIFPGDGHFTAAMANLRASGYDAAIREWIRRDQPFLGICIGLQLLFDSSEEAPGVDGLGIIAGRVKKFPCRKVPQIGWNQTLARDGIQGGTPPRLFKDIPNNSFFYYIHSYYAAPDDDAVTAAEADYAVRYCSAVERGALCAVQFHPEKSGAAGLRLLRNWAEG